MKNNYLAGVLFVLAGVLLLVWTIDGKVSFFQWTTGDRELLESRQVDSSIGELDIQTSDTDVTFRQSRDDALHVEVYGYPSQQDDYRLELDERGDKLEVAYHRSKNRISWLAFDRGHRLVIALPDKAFRSIAAYSSSGDVLAETDLEADEVRLETSSGDVELGNLRAGTLDITTSSGEISAEADIEADQAEWRTSSGDMHVREIIAGTFAVTTHSGELEADRITADTLKIDGANGDMEADECACKLLQVDMSSGDVEFGRLSGTADIEVSSGSVQLQDWEITGDSTIEASSGDVEIGLLHQDQALELDLRASSGDKQIVLPGFEKTGSDKQRLRGQVGSGGPKLSIRTSSGDIHVE